MSECTVFLLLELTFCMKGLVHCKDAHFGWVCFSLEFLYSLSSLLRISTIRHATIVSQENSSSIQVLDNKINVSLFS